MKQRGKDKWEDLGTRKKERRYKVAEEDRCLQTALSPEWAQSS